MGADHGGFELRQQLIEHLARQGHVIRDCGTNSPVPVDYPPIAREVGALVASGACDFGIVVDAAGIGSAIAANKVPGVRAAAVYDEALARSSREHNDANVLTLGARQTGLAAAKAIVDVFLSSECTEERHRARVAMIHEIETMSRQGGALPTLLELPPEELRRVLDRVRQLLDQGGGVPATPPALAPDRLASLIDHTLLRPEATRTDIERLCAEARRFGFYSVCVNPSYVSQAATLLRGAGVKVCCVVGFPLGAQPAEVKALEARRALREGAAEIDMVINIGALKSHEDDAALRDIRAVVEACKDGRAVCKVILETALLTDEEKVRACELAMKAGADFVKTSTGFSSGGAKVEDVALMARTVAPRRLGVKASGGIRTYADVVRMVEAGATRVGCSNSVKIMEEALAKAGAGG